MSYHEHDTPRLATRIVRFVEALAGALVVVLSAVAQAAPSPVQDKAPHTLAPAARGVLGAHSMLQLNTPYGFMQDTFAEAAGMHASAIRLDVAPALVFTQPSAPPDFSGLDHVIALAEQYHLPVVGDLFTIPPWIADCPIPTAQPARCGTNDCPSIGR